MNGQVQWDVSPQMFKKCLHIHKITFVKVVSYFEHIEIIFLAFVVLFCKHIFQICIQHMSTFQKPKHKLAGFGKFGFYSHLYTI